MGTYFGKPPEPPYVDEKDLALLAADIGAGHHPAAYIYEWYVQMITVDGRTPVSKKAFGLAMREAGLQSSVRRMDGERPMTRCWLITLPWKRRGDKLLAEELQAERSGR
jgi:hypothetical protein